MTPIRLFSVSILILNVLFVLLMTMVVWRRHIKPYQIFALICTIGIMLFGSAVAGDRLKLWHFKYLAQHTKR